MLGVDVAKKVPEVPSATSDVKAPTVISVQAPGPPELELAACEALLAACEELAVSSPPPVPPVPPVLLPLPHAATTRATPPSPRSILMERLEEFLLFTLPFIHAPAPHGNAFASRCPRAG